MMKPAQWEALWDRVCRQFPLGLRSEHGPSHWACVEQNGLYLAQTSGARIDVVRLFALFHDSRRQNEFEDPEHGLRGAKLARELRGTLFKIDDSGFDLLHEACCIHTSALTHGDPSIGTCLDADRLDLPRVGITPKAEYMSTNAGRVLAQRGNFSSLRDFKSGT